MKTPEQILKANGLIRDTPVYGIEVTHNISFLSLVNVMTEYASVMMREVQEAYELEQEHNIELVERIEELEQYITHSKESAQYLDQKTLLEENTSLRSYIEDLENTLGLRNRSNPDLTIDKEKPKSLFERWQNLED